MNREATFWVIVENYGYVTTNPREAFETNQGAIDADAGSLFRKFDQDGFFVVRCMK